MVGTVYFDKYELPKPSSRKASEPGKGTCASKTVGVTQSRRGGCGFPGALPSAPGLFDSLRSCPVLGRDFVNPAHPRAVEKTACDWEGDHCVAPEPL